MLYSNPWQRITCVAKLYSCKILTGSTLCPHYGNNSSILILFLSPGAVLTQNGQKLTFNSEILPLHIWSISCFIWSDDLVGIKSTKSLVLILGYVLTDDCTLS